MSARQWCLQYELYVCLYLCPTGKMEQLIWYEKIDGQLMLFTENYYIVSEESLNSLPMVMKFNEKRVPGIQPGRLHLK